MQPRLGSAAPRWRRCWAWGRRPQTAAAEVGASAVSALPRAGRLQRLPKVSRHSAAAPVCPSTGDRRLPAFPIGSLLLPAVLLPLVQAPCRRWWGA
jgi:hypothetical protein